MVTTDLVIARMNALAGVEVAPPLFAEEQEEAPRAVDEAPVADEPRHFVQFPPQAHENEDGDVDEEEAVPIAPLTAEERAIVSAEEANNMEDDIPIAEIMERRRARTITGVRMHQVNHISLKKGLRERGEPAFDAVLAELKQLLKDKSALTPLLRKDLSRRQLKKMIRSCMFLKEKFNAKGEFVKIKARLVADGSMQDRELYPDNASPTVSMQSLWLMLIIMTNENRKMAAIDIKGAYVNADMTGEEVLMELDPTLTVIAAKAFPELVPYMDQRGKMIVRLDKALYGCIQSAKLWYDRLTAVLRAMGFEHNQNDPCIMNKMVNGKQCTLCIYVDDILTLCEDESAIHEVVAGLRKEFDEVEVEFSDDISYLGMRIRSGKGKTRVTMFAYIDELINYAGFTGVKTSPARDDLFECDTRSPLLDKEKSKEFHTIVAKLLYLVKRARPDMAVVVAYLCTRVKTPTDEDWAKLKRLMQYLDATRELEMVLEPEGEMRLEAFIDAAFGCHVDGKSHTGMVMYVGGCFVMAKSTKQKLVTRHSTESELVALTDMVYEVQNVQDFMQEQGYPVGAPILHQDNTSTIHLATKGGGNFRTKHLRARTNYIREQVSDGHLAIAYCPTGRMIADVLTKPLRGILLRVMTAWLLRGPAAPLDRGALSTLHTQERSSERANEVRERATTDRPRNSPRPPRN